MGRQRIQTLDAGATRAQLDLGQQLLAALSAAIVIMHGHAGQLAHGGVTAEVQCRTPDDHAIALQHHIVVDLMFETLPRAGHQDATLLQRPQQRQQATDILEARLAQLLIALTRDHGADAVTGEQLAQQGVTVAPAQQVSAPDAAPCGATGSGQVARQLTVVIAGRRHQRGFLRIELTQQLTIFAEQALPFAKQDQLVSGQRHGGVFGDLSGVQIEHLAGAGIAQRRQHDDGLLREQPLDRLTAHAAHLATMQKVDAMTHTQRLGHHQIAGDGGELDAMQRRIGQPLG